MLRRLLPTALACLLIPASFGGSIPRPAPDFNVSLTNGTELSLSQFRGKAVALIFILTYCPHCQKTVSLLGKAQTEYGPRGFQVVASAIEDVAPKAVPDFIKRFNPPFPVGYNTRGPVLEFLQHPIAARLIMPQLVLIDRAGIIRAQYAGDDPFFTDDQQENNLRGKIEELLKDSAPAKKKSVPKHAKK